MSEQMPKKLLDMIREGAQTFFTTNGIVDLKELPASQKPAEYQWTGVIGLSGETITGSLGISCQENLLNHTHPNIAMGMPVEQPDRIDWLGEIANQVLGRIKNLTLEYGVKFFLSAPSVIKGETLEIHAQGKKLSAKLHYLADGHPVTLTFSCVIAQSFDFDKAEKVKQDSLAKEGESLLF